jgi:sugar lactone lactonase YvrE
VRSISTSLIVVLCFPSVVFSGDLNMNRRAKIILVVLLGVGLVFGKCVIAADLFVSDARDNCIYKITPDGTRSAFASGLNSPMGLAFDSSGNLYEADQGSGNIYKFNPSGLKTLFAGGLLYPSFLAFDTSGNLFGADQGEGIIYKFGPDGSRSIFASELHQPRGLAFDSSGDLFEADLGIGSIYTFTPNGTKSLFASGLSFIGALVFDSSGNLFEADVATNNIYKFGPGPNPTRSTFADGLNGPFGLAFDSNGNLFASDAGSGNIYTFTPDGTRSTFASGLNDPDGLAFAPVPEPSYFTLLGVGAAVLLVFTCQRWKLAASSLIISFLIVTFSHNTYAEVVNADKYPLLAGEQHKNAVLDTTTNRLWLDMTETLGLSYNQVKSKIGSGQEYDGWLLPDLSDLEELLIDANIPYPTSPPGYDISNVPGFNKPISDFLEIYGSPGGTDLGDQAQIWIWTGSSQPMGSLVLSDGEYGNIRGYRARIAISDGYNADLAFGSVGTALFRPVPEPSTLALLCIGAVSLFVFVWRRHWNGLK